jgi:hypothetical protein
MAELILHAKTSMETPVKTKLNTFGLNKPQLISLIVAFIICALALVLGMRSGLAKERSKATYRSSRVLLQALKYYHSDQEAYPTADQFFNRALLVPFYLPRMPVHSSQQGVCKGFTNFQYSQPGPQSFSLKYCLESSIEGEGPGVHELTQKDIQ